MSGQAAPAVGGERARCFLALLPGAAGHDALRACREALEAPCVGAARGVRWLDAASLHLTVRFLGDSTTGQVEFLGHMLPTLARPVPAIDSRRCAIWPNRARPRLLALELGASAALLALATGCEELARKAGFAPEQRTFRPHLTLARLRPGCTLETPSATVPAVRFESLALLQSDLRATGARYRVLAEVPLPVPQTG